MQLVSVFLLGLWAASASALPEEHDGLCAPGAGSTCAGSSEAQEAEAAEEATSLLATRHSVDARSLLSARKSLDGSAEGPKKACAKISGLYSCPSVTSYTCASPFAPPNATTNVGAKVAWDVVGVGCAAMTAAEPWMAVPLAA